MGIPRKKNKNPPVMSHEFVIQNHADILACIAIVIVLGLVSDVTAKISRLFIFLQYPLKNETEMAEAGPDAVLEYNRGFCDIFTVFFASLMIAIAHAVLQEYVIDKVTRKLHLSKMKNSQFTESSQVVVWCLVSAGWGTHLAYKSGIIKNLALMWEGYPHNILEWEEKLFFLCQLAYWVHMYPELYFQKTRKEDVQSRIQYYTLNLIFITGAYILQFWKVAIFLLTLHYIAEALYHGSRMSHYAEKSHLAKLGFRTWEIVFPLVRLLILSVAVLVFWFGLGKVENQGLDFSTGNFNSLFVRVTCLSSVGLLQVWLIWPYVLKQVKRSREVKQTKKKASQGKSKSSGKKNQKKGDADVGNGTSGRAGEKLKKN